MTGPRLSPPSLPTLLRRDGGVPHRGVLTDTPHVTTPRLPNSPLRQSTAGVPRVPDTPHVTTPRLPHSPLRQSSAVLVTIVAETPHVTTPRVSESPLRHKASWLPAVPDKPKVSGPRHSTASTLRVLTGFRPGFRPTMRVRRERRRIVMGPYYAVHAMVSFKFKYYLNLVSF